MCYATFISPKGNSTNVKYNYKLTFRMNPNCLVNFESLLEIGILKVLNFDNGDDVFIEAHFVGQKVFI